jgi:ROK family
MTALSDGLTVGVALDLFEQTGRWVGQLLADLAAILDPAVFVIGGGLSETGELIRRPAERAYRQVLGAASHRAHADVRNTGLPHKEGDLPWVNCSSSGTGKPNGPGPVVTPGLTDRLTQPMVNAAQGLSQVATVIAPGGTSHGRATGRSFGISHGGGPRPRS